VSRIIPVIKADFSVFSQCHMILQKSL